MLLLLLLLVVFFCFKLFVFWVFVSAGCWFALILGLVGAVFFGAGFRWVFVCVSDVDFCWVMFLLGVSFCCVLAFA